MPNQYSKRGTFRGLAVLFGIVAGLQLVLFTISIFRVQAQPQERGVFGTLVVAGASCLIAAVACASTFRRSRREP